MIPQRNADDRFSEALVFTLAPPVEFDAIRRELETAFEAAGWGDVNIARGRAGAA